MNLLKKWWFWAIIVLVLIFLFFVPFSCFKAPCFGTSEPCNVCETLGSKIFGYSGGEFS